MKNRETSIQDSIESYIDDLYKSGIKIMCERRDASGRNYKKGSADIWIAVNGIHIEVEIKTDTGKRSTLQETLERFCKSAGVEYMLVRSLADFKDQLKIYL